MIMVTVQVTDLSRKNLSQGELWGGDLVDFQVVLLPSQVMSANPSDSQVYQQVCDRLSLDSWFHLLCVRGTALCQVGQSL